MWFTSQTLYMKKVVSRQYNGFIMLFSKHLWSYFLTHLRMLVKGTLLHCWWECKLAQPLWRTVWRFLKNLEIELPYDPAIPLLDIHTEETRSESDTCTPMFIAALFIIARTGKQPRCTSADEWIRKLWYIYTMEYYSAIKKFIWISSNEMDETGAHYTEWSKPER